MKIDTAYLTQQEAQQQPLLTRFAGTCVIQIEPGDTLENVLVALRLQAFPAPVILVLPVQGQLFDEPAHFEELRRVCPPDRMSFVIPSSRSGTVARYAHQYGFPFASSLQRAAQLLPIHEERQERLDQEAQPSSIGLGAHTLSYTGGRTVETEKQVNGQGLSKQQSLPPPWPPQPITPLPVHAPQAAQKRPAMWRRVSLIAAMAALLIVAGVVLLPALLSAQPGLTTNARSLPAPAITTVGQVSFTSSGQLDPSSSKGFNDIVTVTLHSLSTPASGQSYYAWLMPDKADDNTQPLLLGRLAIVDGKAQISYTHPNHEDLLALYSRFEIAEQTSNEIPTTPPLNPEALRYEGFIPDTPTPGDEHQYSLLDHLRHLLAKDPTLQEIGLPGGLDIWLDRNSEKILEWSSAARDNWAGGQQTDLMHRHMVRILEYLDGLAYVFTSGDLPAGSPLLVDPKAGRIGLLELTQTQALPGYLTHVDIHLHGLAEAPGHTQAQKDLAIKLDNALKTDTSLYQKIRQDVMKLVKMNATQLRSNDALSLLNDMVTTANLAYTGQFDPTTGGNMNGIAWIQSELQGIATMPVTLPPQESA